MNIQPQLCHNRSAMPTKICYPFQTGTCHAEWWEIQCINTKWPLGKSCKCHHASQEQPVNSESKPRPISTIFGKGKISILSLMQKFGKKVYHHLQRYQAKLANQGTPCIWIGYAKGHLTGTKWIFNPKTKKIILTRYVIFLQKSYGEYSKVEKLVLVTMSYKSSDGEVEPKTFPIINNDNNNNCNLVTDSNPYTNIENDNNDFFDKDINNQVEATPNTSINAKVVHTMKNLQVLSNDDTTKFSSKLLKKNAIKNLNFLIDLAMVTNDIKLAPEKPQIFKPGIIPTKILVKNGNKQCTRNSWT